MQSEDHTNGHKLDYWEHYKTKIHIIIWLHMLAVVYTHTLETIFHPKNHYLIYSYFIVNFCIFYFI